MLFCETCDRKFVNRLALNSHLRLQIHQGTSKKENRELLALNVIKQSLADKTLIATPEKFIVMWVTNQ